MASTPGSATTPRARMREKRLQRVEEMLLVVEPKPHSNAEIVKAIVEEFKIDRRIAQRDLSEVWHRRGREQAANRAAMVAEADHDWRRREAMADAKGEIQAGNFALAQRHRLLGLFAPTKIEHSGSVGITATLDVNVRLEAVIGVLDSEGLAALEVVLGQVERARARGALPAVAAGPDDDDAEAREGIQ
jgi:hypothetical protein